jgi:CheY-like chemotaxis protein
MADAGQIEQVLMNLATNARDAMPGKGRLTIATDMAFLGEDFIRVHGYGKIGKHAHISVSDNGSGMDKETMVWIFEPFFTTKQVGRGTGLGLSMVYGIVKQHEGFITVSSEPGKGTTFDIYFPPAGTAAVEDKVTEEAPIAGGPETILIVEDSPEIREMLCQVLATAGYKVIEAADGQEGVEKFIEHKEEVDLVILDVIMPRKNGREAYEEIRGIDGKIKAIFTSGYTADIISRQGILEGEYNFLAKPLSPNMILSKVRETLDG